jgi:hypothetical protein
MADNRKAKSTTTGMLVLALTGCATGKELHGTWMLTVGRSGTCRVIEHQANTDQLSTSTRWRGEGCGTDESHDQGEVTTVLMEVPR